ncbi:MAG TPA: MerR family transcriptional regulator [Gemmataceae bacterium]|nr:MerR family transcriptional regulator [Gemmataceae bacterium]
MHSPPWKVGELARRTGLSVRSLHHYDAIGLLSPSHRTEAGHRLYAAADAVRLQQIVSLRQLGFSLEEIRDCLDRPEFSPRRVIRLHIDRLKEHMERQRRLCERLETIERLLDSAEKVSADQFLQTIEEMNMLDKYYTPEQKEELKERGRQLGEDRIRQAETEWQEIIAQVRAAMEAGVDPASEPIRRLARRSKELVEAFTGGNPEIQKSLQKMWKQEQNIHGLDTSEMRRMWEYLAKGAPPE